MSPPGPQTILITGATDGIGLALARIYQAQDARLLLVGRRPWAEIPLAEFTDPAAYCRVDLSRPDCGELVAACCRERGFERLDLLIHNAGLGYYGVVGEQSPEDIKQLVAVNLWASVALTHHLLPQVQRAQGKIVFISSVMSALAGPNYAVYTASKAALNGFARNLRLELGSSASVQVIYPGATQTGMPAKSGLTQAGIDPRRFPPAERVAAQIAAAIRGNRSHVTLGLSNQLLHLGGRYAGGLIDGIMRRQTGGSRTGVAAVPTDTQCVITGAADGIGKVLARQFIQVGYPVTGIDVDEAQAEKTRTEFATAGSEIDFIIANLADEGDLDHILNTLEGRPPVSVWVHNAGINAVGRFGILELARQEAVLTINFAAPLLLTAGLLRRNLIAPGGNLVFIASLSHYVGYPGAAVYAATKDGLVAYARSLRVGLARRGINTLTVYPGPTRTAHARRYSPDNRREQRRMPPETLARLIVSAVEKRRRRLIPGLGNQLFAAVGHVLPRVTERLMRKTLFERLD